MLLLRCVDEEERRSGDRDRGRFARSSPSPALLCSFSPVPLSPSPLSFLSLAPPPSAAHPSPLAMVLIHITKSTEEFIYETNTKAQVDVVARSDNEHTWMDDATPFDSINAHTPFPALLPRSRVRLAQRDQRASQFAIARSASRWRSSRARQVWSDEAGS